MNFRRRPGLTSVELLIVLGMAVAALAVCAALISADVRVSRDFPGGANFYSTWASARGFLLEQTGPYGGTAALTSQTLVYGRPAVGGENPLLLTLPFSLVPFFFPLALIPDATVARAVWMFVNQVALIGTVFVGLRLAEWRPRLVGLVLYSLLTAFGCYAVQALLDGTPVILLGLLYASTLWAYSTEHDELAGALSSLTLFAWEVGGVFLLLLAWRVFHEKRWRVLAGFGMMAIVLLAVSFLIYPSWVLAFLTATLASLRSPFGLTTEATLVRLLPAYGTLIAHAVTVLVVSILVYEWATTRESDLRRFLWTALLAIALAPLLGFRLELSSLVALYPCLAFIFAASSARGRISAWFVGIFLALSFLLPWFILGRHYPLRDPRSADYLFLFFPLFITLGLYWTRWWFLRPHGTWLDEVRSTVR